MNRAAVRFRVFLWMALLVLCAGAVQAEVLFAEDFDAQPDFDGTGHEANSCCGACWNFGVAACDDLPPGFGYYINQTASGYGVGISDAATGGNGKSFVFTMRRPNPGASWTQSGILTWWGGVGSGWNEIWVEYDHRFQNGWQFKPNSAQQKMLFIMKYWGDGREGGPRNGDGGQCSISQYGSGNCYGPGIIFDWYNDGFGFQGFVAPRFANHYHGGGINYTQSILFPEAPSWSASRFNNGSWHKMRFHLKLNSAQGVQDGVMEWWLDGELMGRRTNIPWNDGASNNYNDQANGFNAVQLGGNNYNQYTGGMSEQWYAYDNLCIATSEADLEGCFGPQIPQCSDSVDNDGDGLTDAEDPGCEDPDDLSERGTTVCDDGVDNDGDGSIDMADGGCSGPTDGDETNCGDGAASGGELCDGDDTPDADCTDFDFANPAGLACNAACDGYVTSECTNDLPPAACVTMDGSEDFIRVADSGGLTLPDGDWTVGMYTRVPGLGGSSQRHAISTNNLGSNGSFNLYFDESTDGWSAQVVDGDGTVKTLGGVPVFDDGLYRLIVVRKNGGDLDLSYCDGPHGCGVAATTTSAGLAAVNGGEWNLGRRRDGASSSYFNGDLCHLFKLDRAAPDAELVNIARWMDPLADEAAAYLGSDLQADRTGNGHDGTWVGSPFPRETGPTFYPPVCGNSNWESGEQCDGVDLGGATCASVGLGAGVLSCSGSCTYDGSLCAEAGDPPGQVGGVERTDVENQ